MGNQDPVGRIHRLIRAVGDGPHARDIDLAHQVRTVLVSLKDKEGVALLNGGAKKPPPPEGGEGSVVQRCE